MVLEGGERGGRYQSDIQTHEIRKLIYNAMVKNRQN